VKKDKKPVTRQMTQREFVERIRSGCPCGDSLHVRVRMNTDLLGDVEYGGRYIACDGYVMYGTCEYYIGGRRGAWREVDLSERESK
jgi:hypothetical protein